MFCHETLLALAPDFMNILKDKGKLIFKPTHRGGKTLF